MRCRIPSRLVGAGLQEGGKLHRQDRHEVIGVVHPGIHCELAHRPMANRMSDPVSPRAAAPVRIGCAGWAIPSQHAHLFGEGDSHLARYATRFDVAEINSTFYRPHQLRTFERWAASVPARFRFSAKLPKWITHEARLYGTGDALTAFFDGIGGLGAKFGGVLVQLPPSLAFDARLADRFFAMLRRRCAARIACEPRHASWFGPEADRIWTRYAIARAAADPALMAAAALPADGAREARWSYWRWHGAPRMYYSRYDDDALQRLAHALVREGRTRAPSWCLLDNTAHGHAVEDAARLQDAVSEARRHFGFSRSGR